MKPQVPVLFGDSVEMDITHLAYCPEGLGTYKGFAVFVPWTAPGDRVAVTIADVKKNFAVGQLTGILRKSEKRDAPVCSVFAKCGGCHWQHVNYETQLEYKSKFVEEFMKKSIGLEGVRLHPI